VTTGVHTTGIAEATHATSAPGWRWLAPWAALVAAAIAWGTWFVPRTGVALRAAPLMGHWDWRGARGLIPAAVVGAAVAAWAPGLARRLPWRAVPAAAGAGAVAWAVALAAADGWARLTAPLTTDHEYEPLAARIGDIGRFVSGYLAGFDRWPVHVRGHPPGPVVVAWLLDRVGLGGAGWLAVLALAAWGGAAAAALVAARAAAGETAARRAAPALAVLPAAVWAGTSLDALFAGVIALAVALGVVAAARGSALLAAAAGVATGSALMCTYGAVPLLAAGALVAVVVSPAGPPAPPVATAAVAGCGAVLTAAAGAGFWWPAGLAATGGAYWSGIAAERPGLYLTVLGNPAALALAAGPAVVAGLGAGLGGFRGRSRAVSRAALLPGAALLAVAAADVSQMARGEVERIWLPFVPWLALAAPGHRRAWLAAQVTVGLALQAALRSPW
jgi:methylthioxylose transferase